MAKCQVPPGVAHPGQYLPRPSCRGPSGKGQVGVPTPLHGTQIVLAKRTDGTLKGGALTGKAVLTAICTRLQKSEPTYPAGRATRLSRRCAVKDPLSPALVFPGTSIPDSLNAPHAGIHSQVREHPFGDLHTFFGLKSSVSRPIDSQRILRIPSPLRATRAARHRDPRHTLAVWWLSTHSGQRRGPEPPSRAIVVAFEWEER